LLGRPIEALLLVRLIDGPLRFGELAEILARGSGTKPAPSDLTLLRALRRLTAEGSARRRWSTVHRSVVYELTRRGRRRAGGVARLIEEALRGHESRYA
jgi:DNA-binding HxlR family transcriptional regulator